MALEFRKWDLRRCLQCLLIVLITLLNVTCDETKNKINFENGVREFYNKLNEYAERSLGITYLQNHYKTLPTKTIDIGQGILDEMVNDFEDTTKSASRVVHDFKESIEADYNSQPRPKPSEYHDCCGYNRSNVFSDLYLDNVNFGEFCEISQKTVEATRFSANMLKNIEKARGLALHGRYVYYGSEEGYYMQHPAQDMTFGNTSSSEKETCQQFDPRYRPWYVGRVNNKAGKDLVLVIDYSQEAFKHRDRLVELVETLIDNIDSKDRIGLVMYNSDGPYESSFKCLRDGIVRASPYVTEQIKQFIIQKLSETPTSLAPSDPTDAMRSAYRKFDNGKKVKKVLLITSSSSVSAATKEVVTNERGDSQLNIFVLTEPTDLRELKDLVKLGGGKESDIYAIHTTTTDIRQRIASYFHGFMNSSAVEVLYSMPFVDYNGLGILMDALIPCFNTKKTNQLIGVAGYSLVLTDLFRIPEGYETSNSTYYFIIDSNGITYIHPMLALPVQWKDKQLPITIEELETAPGFVEIGESMRNKGSGSRVIDVNVSTPNGESQHYGAANFLRKMKYYWKPIKDSDFSLALVVSEDEAYKNVVFDDLEVVDGTEPSKYYRLDLYDPEKEETCKILNHISLRNRTTVKFAPSMFKNRESFAREMTPQQMYSMMNYFHKITDIIVPEDPFISTKAKSTARNFLISTSVLEDYWKNDLSEGIFHTLWRYCGLANGIFFTYPGHSIPANYDPRERPWYLLAEGHPRKLVLTAPYSDAATGVTLITLSKTITLQNSSLSRVVGVMGIDFTVEHLKMFLMEQVKECKSWRGFTDCFIIDSGGFMIYHPDMDITANMTHIIKKVPLVAEILVREKHMQKRACISHNRPYEQDTVQKTHQKWFYEMTLDSYKLHESVTGCTSVRIIPVATMNIYVLATDHSCRGEGGSCSCPEDGKCKASHDPLICECPCAVENVCIEELYQIEPLVLCKPPPTAQHRTEVSDLNRDWKQKYDIDNMERCYDPECAKLNISSCTLVGCEWPYHYPINKQRCCHFGECSSEFPSSTTPALTTPTTTRIPTKEPTDKPKSDEVPWKIPVIAVLCIVGTAAILIALWALIRYIKKRRQRRRSAAAVFTNPHVTGIEIDV